MSDGVAPSRFRDRRRAKKELGVWRLIVSTDRRLFEAEVAQRRWKRSASSFLVTPEGCFVEGL
ncbi:MAG: hypothetical protein AMJ56_21545 [Anaerolineae bacterium SG8_19]|nr:MAG: hypothetical protein AMJ56_21545 [Anaerolineae bacterium SG8_19]